MHFLSPSSGKQNKQGGWPEDGGLDEAYERLLPLGSAFLHAGADGTSAALSSNKSRCGIFERNLCTKFVVPWQSIMPSIRSQQCQQDVTKMMPELLISFRHSLSSASLPFSCPLPSPGCRAQSSVMFVIDGGACHVSANQCCIVGS